MCSKYLKKKDIVKIKNKGQKNLDMYILKGKGEPEMKETIYIICPGYYRK